MADQMSTKSDEFATVIGPDAQFKGELTFQGGVRIDGKFEGSISTNGKVFISKGGYVKAEIQASSVALEGKIEGNVLVEDRVELRATGQMIGDVTAAKLLVVEGAAFVGRCEVGADVKGAKPSSNAKPDSKTGQPGQPGQGDKPGMRPVGAGGAAK